MRPESGWSPRQILALIHQLPPESAIQAALQGGPEHRGWGIDRYLQANMVDGINMLVTLVTREQAKNPKSIKAPEPVYRPGKTSKKDRAPKKNMFASLAAQQLAAAREQKE